MKLQPTRPPGRTSRKALEYEQEIQRLHAMGYSFESIRAMLAAVGVHVSKGTVRREAARAPATPPAPSSGGKEEANRTPPSRPPAPVNGEGPPRTPQPPILLSDRSSKEIAEEYFKDHISNPLLRNKGP